MHDLTAIGPPAPAQALAARNADRRRAKLRRLYPTVGHLRAGARRHIPHFAFEYLDGGAGSDDAGIRRNWAALDAVEVVARYGATPSLPACAVELFGRRYAAPIGIAPMGGPAVVWPGADLHLARAAQAAQIPYTLATPGTATIEDIAAVAADVFWFQLYRFPNNDHAIGIDLMRRAEAAGCRVLVLTLDVPVRTTRPRETAVGLDIGFHLDLRMILQAPRAPRWLRALWGYGVPRFANLRAYVGADAAFDDVIAFARREMRGAFSWEEVAKYRDRWKGTLIIKGVLHPQDADKAVSLGIDGLVVSNHGGRQLELLPPPIDVLPAIRRAVGNRASILMDSGIRSGADVVRACALGADATFAGKAFLWGLGALGENGGGHVIDILIEETQAALAQLGAHTLEDTRSLAVRHERALPF